ncbi:hypothetical protein [Mariprofundus ferrinatatus]|uniref:hypothetical protein n=1 Tax=Mariprofundus ferrinatatus TaxID=1921087 RepID=UPI0018E2561F|nr:hypothetical protein [Mariprofundus ferrinatatus]
MVELFAEGKKASGKAWFPDSEHLPGHLKGECARLFNPIRFLQHLDQWAGNMQVIRENVM